jgi:hypothetical protein
VACGNSITSAWDICFGKTRAGMGVRSPDLARLIGCRCGFSSLRAARADGITEVRVLRLRVETCREDGLFCSSPSALKTCTASCGRPNRSPASRIRGGEHLLIPDFASCRASMQVAKCGRPGCSGVEGRMVDEVVPEHGVRVSR